MIRDAEGAELGDGVLTRGHGAVTDDQGGGREAGGGLLDDGKADDAVTSGDEDDGNYGPWEEVVDGEAGEEGGCARQTSTGKWLMEDRVLVV